MKFPIATKIVKTKDSGTATLTRIGKRVYACQGTSTVKDIEFPTVSKAKHYMGSTTTI